MHKNDRLTKFLCAIALIIILAPCNFANAEEMARDYLEEARLHAETAKSDAQKAMAEAEEAIAEADAAIARANAAKANAMEVKKNALEKMVEAQYFPDDIDMTLLTSEGKTTAVFSHKKHTEREHLRCIECHPRVFKMKVGDAVVKGSNISMKEMQKGQFCGNCHNGEKAFDVTSIQHCKKCHPDTSSK